MEIYLSPVLFGLFCLRPVLCSSGYNLTSWFSFLTARISCPIILILRGERRKERDREREEGGRKGKREGEEEKRGEEIWEQRELGVYSPFSLSSQSDSRHLPWICVFIVFAYFRCYEGHPTNQLSFIFSIKISALEIIKSFWYTKWRYTQCWPAHTLIQNVWWPRTSVRSLWRQEPWVHSPVQSGARSPVSAFLTHPTSSCLKKMSHLLGLGMEFCGRVLPNVWSHWFGSRPALPLLLPLHPHTKVSASTSGKTSGVPNRKLQKFTKIIQ